MDSTPPATTTFILSTTTCLAAVAIAMSPDAHWRSIVIPATETGSPARNAAVRPIVCCTPCGIAAPYTTSSTSFGSMPDRSTAARMACRSEEHTSELQSLMRISYAVFCLKKNTEDTTIPVGDMFDATETLVDCENKKGR